MNDSINPYFQKELQGLQEWMQAYAKEYPLGSRSHEAGASQSYDPHIERLLEGSAYLSARVRQQIDLGILHLGEGLLRRFASHMALDKPSLTIIEFSSFEDRLVESEIIPQGVLGVSKPVGEDSVVCRFKTLSSLTVHPIVIQSIELLGASQGQDALKISFRVQPGAKIAELDITKLDFFIHAPWQTALSWHYYLTRAVKKIIFKAEQLEYEMPRAFFKPINLLPSGKDFERLVQFGQLNELGLFIRLEPLALPLKTDQFDLIIEFQERISVLTVQNDLLKMHCVPAMNVFETTTEPICVEPHKQEYPICVDSEHPQGTQLVDVKMVTGMSHYHTERIQFKDQYDLISDNAVPYSYRLFSSFESEARRGKRLFVSGALDETMILSCSVWACNGMLPWKCLNLGDIQIDSPHISQEVVGSNIVLPSPMISPSLTQNFVTQALQYAHISVEQLSDLKLFKKIMTFYDSNGLLTQVAHRITSCALKPYSMFLNGALIHCIEYTLFDPSSHRTALFEANFVGAIWQGLLEQLTPFHMHFVLSIKMSALDCSLTWGKG